MTATVVTIPIQEDPDRSIAADQRVQIIVHINAEIIDVEAARRRVNGWLLDNGGNLLGATKPELVLNEQLYWRFDVILGLPNMAQPGSGAMYRVGQIMLDAVTGKVEGADALAEELHNSVAALAH